MLEYYQNTNRGFWGTYDEVGIAMSFRFGRHETSKEWGRKTERGDRWRE
jgi:hypothetical protein